MSGRVPILMYHSVSEVIGGELADYTLSPKRFAAHVAHLCDRGYVAYSVSQWQDAIQLGNPLADRPVVLTFDDAFEDFLANALPVLVQARMPATMYVPTGYLGGVSGWLTRHRVDSRPVMSATALSELVTAGIEIGAHSHSHAQLDLVPRERLDAEVRRPKAILEDLLGREVASFAYPFGYYDRRVRRAVAASGYRNAVRVDHLSCWTTADPYAFPRLIINARTSVDDLDRMLASPTSRVDRIVARAKALAWRTARRVRRPSFPDQAFDRGH